MVRGEAIKEMEGITIEILNYYPNLFKGTDIWRSLEELNVQGIINEEEQRRL